MSPPRQLHEHPPAPDHHDHTCCIARALSTATELCKHRGVRLTALRRRVLELVWRAHEPIGAYGLLQLLRRDGRVAEPPTVYRALEFLLEQGLVHRIESLNAYIGCIQPEQPHASQYLICRSCGWATELNDPRIAAALAQTAAESGFEIKRQTIEVLGRCSRCREAKPHER